MLYKIYEFEPWKKERKNRVLLFLEPTASGLTSTSTSTTAGTFPASRGNSVTRLPENAPECDLLYMLDSSARTIMTTTPKDLWPIESHPYLLVVTA